MPVSIGLRASRSSPRRTKSLFHLVAAQETYGVATSVSFGGFAQQVLELGKDLLDRVQVGAVGRQEQEPGTDAADRGTDGGFLWLDRLSMSSGVRSVLSFDQASLRPAREVKRERVLSPVRHDLNANR